MSTGLSSNAAAVYGVIFGIRRAFQEFRSFGDALHADVGVTTAERALLEHLSAKGPTTAPDIARDMSVSRQHIQQLADTLVARKLLQFCPNPAHKRSQLIELSETGQSRFTAMREREAAQLELLAEKLDPLAVAGAAALIASLRTALATLDPIETKERND